MAELLEFQKPVVEKAVAALTNGRVFIVSTTTGSGKSYMAAETIRRLGKKALIISPKVSIPQWWDVAKAMGVEEQIIDVINPEKISTPRGCVFYTRESGWRLPKDSIVVMDEWHRSAGGDPIGKKDAPVTAQAFLLLHAYPSIRLIAMTATLADTVRKFYAIGYWLGFHPGTKSGYTAWCRSHGCAWRKFGWGPRQKLLFEFTKDKTRAKTIMRNLREEMGERFVSMGPDDIPGFPDEIREVCYVDLDKRDHDEIVAAYEAMPDSYKAVAKEDEIRILRERQRAELCKAGVIAEMAEGLEAEGASVFVMLNFTEARTRVEEQLRRHKIPFASIYGGQKDDERQKGIDAFQSNEIHVIVGMAQACSVAVSLHDLHHERPRVSLISPGYNSAEFLQGLGRIRRVGGTLATQKIIIARDTVEERVGRTIERKVCTIDALNGTELTDDDLKRK